MALNFPANPVVGQPSGTYEYTAPDGTTVIYTWDGEKWTAKIDGGSSGINPPGDTEPGTPEHGDLWVDTSFCPPVLKLYVDDALCPGDGGWQEIKGGNGGGDGSTPIDPSPGDGNAEITPPVSGTGTELDPYVLTAKEAKYGGGVVTDETISFSNQTPGTTVQFFDQNIGPNGNRFAQPLGVIAADGTWSGVLQFIDLPVSAEETTFEGLLKIGQIYYSWVVTAKSDVVIKKPEVLSPAQGAGIGGDPAPCADNIQFLSSKPETTTGTVNTWGDATWELENTDTNAKQTASVTLKGNVESEPGPTSFTLEDDTNYSVRVKYSSADPAGGLSEWSDANSFKTCSKDTGWFAVKAPEDNSWYSITHGDGKFVAIANTGNSNRIMYAEDPTNANNWTAIASPADNGWTSVAYGEGKFVAVASSGSNRIMYATDPTQSWTAVASPDETNTWYSVTYGNGKFVAIATNGGTDRIMYADATNLDTWTLAAAPVNNFWYSVTYGEGKFVIVANNGDGNRVMYADESDLNTWTAVDGLEENQWRSVTYGNGYFVATAVTGTKRIMYANATDLNTWTAMEPPEDNQWNSVTYGDGKFVSVAYNGTSNRVMYATNPTGTNNWTVVAVPEDNGWMSVTYGDGKFVSVANNGSSNRIMYATDPTGNSSLNLFYDENNAKSVSDVQLERRYGVDANDTDLLKFGVYSLTEQPDYPVAGFAKAGDAYKPLRDHTSEIEEAQATIETLRSRLSSIEADEVNDDATDTALLTLIANLTQRVEDLEGGA